jgi:hypothetical protein
MDKKLRGNVRGRWLHPVRDSGGLHDRRSAVISQDRGDARSVHNIPIKKEPKAVQSSNSFDNAHMPPPIAAPIST